MAPHGLPVPPRTISSALANWSHSVPSPWLDRWGSTLLLIPFFAAALLPGLFALVAP